MTLFPSVPHSALQRALVLIVSLLLPAGRTALAAETQLTDSALTLMTWNVDGVRREAAVYRPATAPAGPMPLVFVFHGANNSMNSIIRFFAFHGEWPDAVIVYMQGMVRPGGTTAKHKDGKTKSGTGWQSLPGESDDRDLAFFDAVLATLRTDHPIDPRRIFITGHSNGAGFSCLLWQMRGDTIAAVATVAGGLLAAFPEAVAALRPGVKFVPADPTTLLPPKPALFVAGRKDPQVRFESSERMVAIAKRVNGCDETQVPWGIELCAMYPSKTGRTPVATYFHPGGHNVPTDAVSLITQFFKENPKP